MVRSVSTVSSSSTLRRRDNGRTENIKRPGLLSGPFYSLGRMGLGREAGFTGPGLAGIHMVLFECDPFDKVGGSREDTLLPVGGFLRRRFLRFAKDLH